MIEEFHEAIPERFCAQTKYLIERSNELSSIEPLVAYYCRYIAAKKVIPNIQTPEEREFCGKLITNLEKSKVQSGAAPQSPNGKDRKHVEAFCLTVFANAVGPDRRGQANMQTALTYRAAAAFFEVLQSLNNPENRGSHDDKLKLCKVRAAAISSAVRQGQPIPPGPWTDVETPIPRSAENDDIDDFLMELPSVPTGPVATNDNFDLPAVPVSHVRADASNPRMRLEMALKALDEQQYGGALMYARMAVEALEKMAN